jgi:hypothetical protein
VTGQVFSNVPWTPGNAFTKNYFASGRVVVAQVQETTVANPGEFDWVPVGAQVLLNGAQSGGNASTEVVFTGTVPMPTGLKAGAKHQLLLTELELFSTDAEVKFPQSQTPAPTNSPTGQFQTADSSVHIVDPNSTSRVIFSDIVSLPY